MTPQTHSSAKQAYAESGSQQAFRALKGRTKSNPSKDKGQQEFPEGMLPNVEVSVPGYRRKMVRDVAKNLFPGKKSIGELSPAERARWIPLACSLLHGDPETSRQIEVAGKAVSEVEIALTRERAAAEEAEQKEREAREEALQEADLTHKTKVTAHQERQTQIADEEWKLKKRAWKQRLKQERKREANGDRIERFLIGMVAITFTAAIGMIIAGAAITQLSGDPASLTGWAIAAGGSGGMGLLSVVLLALHRTRVARIGLEPLPGLTPPAAQPSAGEALNEASE